MFVPSAVVAALLSVPLPAPPSPEAIAAMVRRLGADDFDAREKASADLWAAGPAAEPALRRAARSGDPEVNRRAGALLARFDAGPGVPPLVTEQAAEYRTGETIRKINALRELCNRGGEPGASAALRLAAAEPDPDIRRAVTADLAVRVRQLVPVLLADGADDEFEVIVSVGLKDPHVSAGPTYAAWHHDRGSAAEAIGRLRRQADRTPGETDALATLLLVTGDAAGAADLARRTPGTWLQPTVLFHAGDWAALARDGYGEGEAERLGYRAAFLRLAGDRDGFEQAVADLRRWAAGKPADGARQAAKNLIVLGRPGEAAEVLRAAGCHADLFELLVARGAYREALAVGRPADPPARLRLDLAAAVLRSKLGDRSAARAAFDRSADEAAVVDPSGPSWVAAAEYRAGSVAAFDRLARLLPSDPSWGRATTLSAVYGDGERGDEADALWYGIRRRYAGESSAESLARLRRVLAGPTAADVRDLAPAVMHGLPALREDGWRVVFWLAALARLCERAGAPDLAEQSVDTAAKAMPGPHAFETRADFLARRGRWAEAAAGYAATYRAYPELPYPVFFQGRALVNAGREREGRDLIRRAVRLSLCDVHSRRRMAEVMAADGESDAADRALAVIPLLGDLRYNTGDIALDRRAALAARRGDHARAAEYLDRSRVYRHDKHYLPAPQHHLGLAATVHRYRALAHLGAGDVPATVREAEEALRVLPGDLDTPLELAPRLDTLGRRAEADALYRRAAAAHRRVLDDFPDAAGHHAALARLAAGCRRDLDAGRTHGRRAVGLTPDDPAAVAALAEVLFARREVDEAVERARRCVELDPADDAHRERLVRFLGGHRTP